ncbi:MAG: hypothetical protein R3F61_23345 [Myxococcota bacterium]
MSRSALSAAVLFLAVASSIATSGTDAQTVLDGAGDAITDPSDPTVPTDPTDPTDTDPCDGVAPIAPMTDVVCLAPGEALTVEFGLRVDTSALATLVSTPNWVNGAALLDSDDAEVEITLASPDDAMSEVLATEPAFPIDENVVSLDDPMLGCAAVASHCTSTGWSFTIDNVGDTPAVVHFQIQPVVANGAASIVLFEL